MNRYILIHRLTGPAILLLLGTVALLHQAHVVSWDIFVPLLLILIGVIKLAERTAMANDPNSGQYPPVMPYQGGVNPPGAPPYPAQPYPAPQYPAQTSIVPASHDFGDDPNGGKS
jgi:hypothetical protein